MGKVILIAGFGRIGKSLIKKCLGFDMQVNVYDPFIDSKVINDYGGTKVNSIEAAVKESDFISIHMPLNSKTKNLINYNLIGQMKKNCIIINTARGGIVNEQDLNKALNENLIFGAGIDVFEKEPPSKDNLLLKNNKVIMSPHVSALTDECKIRMAKEAVKNIIDFFENKLDKSVIVKL
jgi:D-3-phosphoglycerate dehydrogenase